MKQSTKGKKATQRVKAANVKRCDRCHGKGVKCQYVFGQARYAQTPCRDCNGSGHVLVEPKPAKRRR
jgi:DnaJ-class molecular chaperone